MNHRKFQFLDPQGRQFGFKFLNHCDKSTSNFRMFYFKILEETGFEELPEQTYNNLELWYWGKSIYNIRDNSGQEIDVAVLETCFPLAPDFEDFYSRITYMVSGGKPLEVIPTSELKAWWDSKLDGGGL